MSQLLLELLTEEIPARMQVKAQADLAKAVGDGLKDAGLTFDSVEALSGPRRLSVVVEGLPAKSEDVREERKGPKVGAPEKAIAGFMRGAGLGSIDEAEIREDKKGQFYVAVIETPGRKTSDIVADMIPAIVRNFHWPKSMRWGTGDLRWVRPLQRILCVFDGKVVKFDIDGIASANATEGHRVMGRGPFKVKGFEDYRAVLEGEGHVRLDREDRKALIEKDAHRICKQAGLELVEDIGLLEEVAGLAEWPVVIMGDMDPKFLELPPEVIRLSMRVHQKYFAVHDPKTGNLAPKFIVVANMDAADGGKTIAAGNAKVLSARLSDAVFFWENDKANPLEENFEKLGAITFHEKLGTVKDKAERVMDLARDLSFLEGFIANDEDVQLAAKLAKCDLVTDMVFEFTELEGVMGRYYALEEKRPARIADAIRDHYKPKGPSDDIPIEAVSVIVALADKIDTISGFWAIDEKPTGSKDPFALRRAALGIIRVLIENEVRMSLRGWLERQVGWISHLLFRKAHGLPTLMIGGVDARKLTKNEYLKADGLDEATQKALLETTMEAHQKANDLLSFFADRLKVYLRDKGQRHDLIDAVFALGEDDLVLVVKRVEALSEFLSTDDGVNLLAGYKRAVNILGIEEKKDKKTYGGDVIAERLVDDTERKLQSALQTAVENADKALKAEDFKAAMAALSTLRAPVDAFFDEVLVNADDPSVRENRLNLLAQIRDVTGRVADFGRIEG